MRIGSVLPRIDGVPLHSALRLIAYEDVILALTGSASLVNECRMKSWQFKGREGSGVSRSTPVRIHGGDGLSLQSSLEHCSWEIYLQAISTNCVIAGVVGHLCDRSNNPQGSKGE